MSGFLFKFKNLPHPIKNSLSAQLQVLLSGHEALAILDEFRQVFVFIGWLNGFSFSLLIRFLVVFWPIIGQRCSLADI